MTEQRFVYRITPIGKVRMSQRDKWAKRPCVLRYRAYHDRLRELGATLEPGDGLHFRITMPPSWSAKKRAAYDGQPHTQKPDLTNLMGGYEDGVLEEDKGIWCLGATSKRWTAGESHIIIVRNEDTASPDTLPSVV
jgi:hypothetical protein